MENISSNPENVIPEKYADLQYDQLLSIFTNFPEVLYVVDPVSYEVLWVNDIFSNMLGNNPIGKICYKAFQNLDAPCSFCTNDILKKNNGKPHTWEHHNKLIDKHFYITDQLIDWYDGRKVRFEVAIDISKLRNAEKERDKLVYEMNERIKELRCIYDISKIVEIPGVSLDELLERSVEVIQRSWQFPEITCVRIKLDDKVFQSANWSKTKWSMKKKLSVFGKNSGCLEVGYLEARPQEDEGPFLKEERSLINALAERFSHIIERMRDQVRLAEYQKQLENHVKKQSAEIMELSTPCLQIWDGILAVPLIGSFDSNRIKLFTDRFLEEIIDSGATVVILDITGLDDMDTQTAKYLIESFISAELLGSKVIITGINASIAQTMIRLGISFEQFRTYASLSKGLREAITIVENN